VRDEEVEPELRVLELLYGRRLCGCTPNSRPPRAAGVRRDVHLKVHGLNAIKALFSLGVPEDKGREQERLSKREDSINSSIPNHRSASGATIDFQRI